MILPNVTDPFFAMLAQGVCSALGQRGYRTILSTTAYDPEAEQRCIQMVQQNKVDGIIGLTYTPDLDVDPRLPYVSIDRYFSPGVPCVSSDNFGGGQLAAETLLKLGCARPLFLRIGSKVPGESDKRTALSRCSAKSGWTASPCVSMTRRATPPSATSCPAT